MYQPTQNELTTYQDRADRKHNPLLTKLTQRALELIENHSYFYTDAHGWKCYSSQSNSPTQAYVVNGKCSCPAYQQGHDRQHSTQTTAGTISTNGQIFCKHRIGLNIYREILRNHLNLRILGPFANMYQGSVAIRAKTHPMTYLGIMTDHPFNQSGTAASYQYTNDRIPSAICDVIASYPDPESNEPTYCFKTDQDASKFSHWLQRAQPLPPGDEKASQAIYNEMREAGFSSAMANLAAQATNCTTEAQLQTLWTESGYAAFKTLWSPITNSGVPS